jgi:Flp pilus assembly pilin Flp
MRAISLFVNDDSGQDLVEYSLLIMFVAIACIALISSGRPATNAIWSSANSQITNAGTFAS